MSKRRRRSEKNPTPERRRTNPGVNVCSIGRRATSTPTPPPAPKPPLPSSPHLPNIDDDEEEEEIMTSLPSIIVFFKSSNINEQKQ
jgi:hypothetical protein